jgi:hypothetical protein
LEGAEGDFAVTASGDRNHRRPAEVEMVAVPNVGFDDAPAADKQTGCRRAHVGAATSLGKRTRL